MKKIIIMAIISLLASSLSFACTYNEKASQAKDRLKECKSYEKGVIKDSRKEAHALYDKWVLKEAALTVGNGLSTLGKKVVESDEAKKAKDAVRKTKDAAIKFIGNKLGQE